MKLGVQLPHFGRLASAGGTSRIARDAAALGFDSVWVGDHVVYPAVLAERFGETFLEAVTTLACVAAAVPRVGLGTAVLVLPYHHPVRLARQLATIAAFAGDRLVVGVGAGWLEEEHRALGAPWRERGAYTDESIRVMRALWTEDRPRFDGRWVTLPEVVFGPRPAAPPPLWVGGNSSRALRRAALLGDGWLPIWHAPTGRGFTPEALRARAAEMAEMRARAGRPGRGEVAALMPLAITERARPGPSQPLVGPAEAIVEMLGRYREAGLGHVVLSPYYGVDPALAPVNLARVVALLERFARDVAPKL